MSPSRAVAWGVGALAALCIAGALSANAAPPSPLALEVLGFGGDGEASFTRLWALSATAPAHEIGRISHPPGSSVKGALLSNRRVAAVAQRDEARERSWAGALYLVAEERTEALVDRVYEGSWPVAIDGTHVLVARGEAGRALSELAGEQRIDSIFIDEIDIATKVVKRIYQSHGYLALPIGRHNQLTVLVEVGPAGVSLVAVNSTGVARVVADELLLGREFSLDGERNSVFCQVRHPEQRDRWQVLEIDLATGRKQRVLDGAHYAMLPARWPEGQRLAINPADGSGLQLFDLQSRRLLPPLFDLGRGLDEVAAVSADRRGVAVLHHGKGSLELWLLDAKTNRPYPVRIPSQERRFEVVGVVPAKAHP